MISCFPTPYPDELLYSVLARLRGIMGFLSGKTFLQELFGTTTLIAVADLPSRLDALTAHLPTDYGYTPDQLIDEFTLLPYYGWFLPKARYEQLRTDMRSGHGAGIHMRAGIMASRIKIVEYFKLCPSCFQEDLHQWGESYWRRVHQLPGVVVCPVHGTALLQSDIRTTNARTRYEYIPVSFAPRTIPLGMPPLNTHAEHMLLELARSSAWLLAEPTKSINPSTLHWHYRALLADAGLATHRGRIRVDALIQTFRAYYTDNLLNWLDCGFAEHSSDLWLLRLVRKPQNAQHPLCHLLLIHFLGYTAERFVTSLIQSQDAQAEGTFVLQPAEDHENMQSSTIKVSSIIRQEKRSSWITLRTEYPTLGIKALRDMAAGLYTWLYRHDRGWLRANTPPRQKPEAASYRVDWLERDRQLAQQVPDAAMAITQRLGKPRRITLTELGKILGHLALIQQHADKLPRTIKVITAHVESREAFAARRIRWAANQYRAEGEIPKRWELIRRSGTERVADEPGVRIAIDVELARFADGKSCPFSNKGGTKQ